jgi:hypothetical protein
MFGRGWERAEATIVAAEFVPVHKGDRYSHNVYVVEVRPAGRASFRAKLAQPETGPHFAFPKQGQVIGVRCQPKSQKVKWDHSDPRSFNTGQVDDQQAKLDAALHAPTSSQSDSLARSPGLTTPSGSRSNGDADESIEQARQFWRENLKRGYCTQAEFDEQMRQLDDA